MLISNDLQTLFNTALVGVVEQGQSSVGASTRCAYTNVDGYFKCAAGHCLTDDALDKVKRSIELLETSIDDLIDIIEPDNKVSGDTIGFLGDLQEAHDDAHCFSITGPIGMNTNNRFLDRFIDNMKIAAKNHNLKFDENLIK